MLIVALAGCVLGESTPEALRSAWLVDALVDANQVWLSRDPSLLAAKYEVMAEDPYDWVRGTADVFLRDLARPGADRAETTFGHEPGAVSMLLVGDPHPENFGTFLPGEGPGPTDGVPVLRIEANDFDAAGYGPYLVDVRRALLGLAVLVEPVCDCRDEVVAAWVHGWIDELEAIDAGAPTLGAATVPGRSGQVVDRLLVDVLDEGIRREQLLEATTVLSDGRRRFRIDPEVDGDGDGILLPTLEERAQIERLLAAYVRPSGFRVLDVARRYGAGVASLPAVRYVVAWDRGSPAPDDDELLQIREVVDPTPIPGFRQLASPLLDDAATRSVDVSLALWSRPDTDVRVSGLFDGGMAFKVLSWSSWNTSFDHRKIQRDVAQGRSEREDLVVWAEQMGRWLATIHARSPSSIGGTALGPILHDLGDRQDAFLEERLTDAEHDLERALADHDLFLAALERHGPILGADLLSEGPR